jgi:mono/diheme cytochrome c family protein
MLIYNGTQFPAPYRGGAFIAFHGSWNRAPAPQGGYNVVFQPLEDGKAAGNFIVFADGFAGAVKDPGRATARPTGLAVGPDGALYIADDVHGRIWRVTYVGGAATGIAPAPAPVVAAADGSNPLPPEGMHPDAGRSETASLPIPPGGTKEQVALGDRIFHGEVDAGTCSGCHGSDAKGSPMGANLVAGPWRKRGDNDTLEWITNTIVAGVPHPKNYPGAMPPMGGAQLSQQDVAAVAAYVWGVSHEQN